MKPAARKPGGGRAFVLVLERQAVYRPMFGQLEKGYVVVGNMEMPPAAFPVRDVEESDKDALRTFPPGPQSSFVGESRLEPWFTSWSLERSVRRLSCALRAARA